MRWPGFDPARNVVFVLGFNHHARQRLGAGVAQHDAPGFAKCRFGFFESARDLRQRFQRGFERTFTLTIFCGKIFKIRDQ